MELQGVGHDLVNEQLNEIGSSRWNITWPYLREQWKSFAKLSNFASRLLLFEGGHYSTTLDSKWNFSLHRSWDEASGARRGVIENKAMSCASELKIVNCDMCMCIHTGKTSEKDFLHWQCIEKVSSFLQNFYISKDNRFLIRKQLLKIVCFILLFPGGSVVKDLPPNAGDARDEDSTPGSGRFPWNRKWQPTPVLLPGESHGQRSLAGYSPWGCKESERTEWLSTQSTYFVLYLKTGAKKWQ